MLEIKIHVDTNDYDEIEPPIHNEWRWQISARTTRQWETYGQTGYWTIDGDTYCGTVYRATVEYSGEDGKQLFILLMDRLRNLLGERLLRVFVDGVEVKFKSGVPTNFDEFFK